MTGETAPSDPRPRRRWVVWAPLGCLGFFVVSLLLLSGVVAGRARSRWASFLPRNNSLKARVTAVRETRPLVEPPGLPGDAWPAYLMASRTLNAMPNEDKTVFDNVLFTKKRTPEGDAKAWATLDKHAAQVDALRAASQLRSCRPVIEWEKGFLCPLDFLAPMRFGGRCLVVSARRNISTGNLDAALSDVAALLQSGIDLGQSGPAISWLVGTALVRMGLTEAREVALAPGITAEQRKRLASMLERAEQLFPPIETALDGEHLCLNETFRGLAEGRLDPSVDAELGKLRLLAWKQGFSYKILAADTDEACTKLLETMRDAKRKPWPQAVAMLEKAERHWSDSAVLGMVMVSSQGMARSERGTFARFRLLRASLAETPPATMPVDPFTMRELHRDAAGRMWSEWTDGDNAGVGTWEEDPPTTGDIVIELPPAR